MANINGTPGNDLLRGTNGDDVIKGEGGNDTLRGNDGDDIYFDGNGRDTLVFGDGANIVRLADDNHVDVVIGATRNDLFDLRRVPEIDNLGEFSLRVVNGDTIVRNDVTGEDILRLQDYIAVDSQFQVA